MAYTTSPLFPGDLFDTAARLGTSLAHGTRGLRTEAPPPEGSDGWRQMLALGWQGVWLAEADGGFGGHLSDLAAILEALGRRAIAAPLIERAGVVPALLAPFADQPAVRALLEAHASGEASICPVLSSSPELPSPHDRPLLARDGTLSGTLRGIDLTEPATHLLFAVTDAEGTRHLLLAEAPALLVGARTYSGNDGRRCADLALDDRVLPAGDPIASGPRAVQALASGQAVASLLACVQAVGEAAALLEQTIEYLNTRVQFGVALSTFQALRHRVVDMYVAYENAYGMVRHLVQAHAQAPLPLAEVLSARLYLASVSRMVGESAIQLHGGMGMATETLAGRLAVRSISAGAFDHGGRAQCLDWLTAHALAETV